MKSSKKQTVFKVLKTVKNVFLVAVIIFLTLVLIMSLISRISGNAPSVFGFSLYRVSSGSMAPELKVGDIILVNQCDGKTVQENEIVSFVPTSGAMKDKLVTHRVVKAPYEAGGEYYFVTKGDANSSFDTPERVSQIKGRLVTKIPLLNYLFDFFATPWGLLTIIVLVVLVFFNEIVILVKTLMGIGVEPEPTPEERAQQIIERYQSGDDRSDSNEALPQEHDSAGE